MFISCVVQSKAEIKVFEFELEIDNFKTERVLPTSMENNGIILDVLSTTVISLPKKVKLLSQQILAQILAHIVTILKLHFIPSIGPASHYREIIAKTHAWVENTHFPTRCIIEAWEARSRRLSAFQVILMH